MFCPECGGDAEDDWNFCLHCGENLTDYPQGPDSQPSNKTDDKVSNDSGPDLLSEVERTAFKTGLQRLSPYEFEEFVGAVWEAYGWDAEVTQGSQDRGIDIVAEQNGDTELIQVKRYALDNKVGSNEIRKYATLYQQESDVDSIAVVTASTFTTQADQLARDLNINAVDGDDLYERIQDTELEADYIETSSSSQISRTDSSLEGFKTAYNEFNELNTELATTVFEESSRAAKNDGVEAAFARTGNRDQLRFAVEMRNEWASIVVDLKDIVDRMEGIPDQFPQAEFARLIGEQHQSMQDLSEAYQRAIIHKDELINSRFETPQIEPGTLQEMQPPDAPILPEPTEDIEDLKHSQDVAMTIAAKETGKIGDLSEQRRRMIERIAERVS